MDAGLKPQLKGKSLQERVFELIESNNRDELLTLRAMYGRDKIIELYFQEKAKRDQESPSSIEPEDIKRLINTRSQRDKKPCIKKKSLSSKRKKF